MKINNVSIRESSIHSDIQYRNNWIKLDMKLLKPFAIFQKIIAHW